MEEEREEAISGEEWLPIFGFEGRYDVSNLGNVRRMMTITNTFAGKILKTSINSAGYPIVSLCFGGKKHTTYVHRLVIEAFIGRCPNGKRVNHKDGNKANNRLDNLEYVTQSENILHAFATGLASNQGENNPNSKLTEIKVCKIKRLLGKESQKEIAGRFNVSPETISLIASGKTWTHVKEPDDLTNAKKCV